MAVQQRQHVAAVGVAGFISRLISMFAFDILQIPSGCNKICSGCIALTCIPLVVPRLRGLVTGFSSQEPAFHSRADDMESGVGNAVLG